MKKVLALGAMAVVLGLSCFVGTPVMAVSTAAVVETSAAEVAAAVTRAEEAIAKTAGSTVNATEVAAMREYLQKWVAQARTLDLERLTAGQLKELVAALDEGALGLRMKAGVDRKATTGVVSSSESAAAGSAGATVNGAIAEPRTVKAEDNAKATEAAKTTEAVKTSEVTEATKVAEASKVSEAKTVAPVAETTQVIATLAVKAEVAAIPGAVKASTGSATISADSVATDTENAEVDVPKTGANEEAEHTSNAVRGMGLVLGGAVVLAAAGAVLIVKRMKRGL